MLSAAAGQGGGRPHSPTQGVILLTRVLRSFPEITSPVITSFFTHARLRIALERVSESYEKAVKALGTFNGYAYAYANAFTGFYSNQVEKRLNRAIVLRNMKRGSVKAVTVNLF